MQHEAAAQFVSAGTRAASVPLLPGLPLHLAIDPISIFAAAEAAGFERPYWAFAWPGGQALARFIADHPAEVAGKCVLDVGAGSGLAAIAALKAGAASAIANDTDPAACAAAGLNAVLNDVGVSISGSDLLDGTPEADLILVGDLAYETALAGRVRGFLDRALARGACILYGDRSTIAPPQLTVRLLAEYDAPLMPAMEPGYMERGRIWRIGC